jgi:hypothetical protein
MRLVLVGVLVALGVASASRPLGLGDAGDAHVATDAQDLNLLTFDEFVVRAHMHICTTRVHREPYALKTDMCHQHVSSTCVITAHPPGDGRCGAVQKKVHWVNE